MMVLFWWAMVVVLLLRQRSTERARCRSAGDGNINTARWTASLPASPCVSVRNAPSTNCAVDTRRPAPRYCSVPLLDHQLLFGNRQTLALPPHNLSILILLLLLWMLLLLLLRMRLLLLLRRGHRPLGAHRFLLPR